ncbi:MAG: hypothetical protein J07HQX50_01484 [Haloquadratum sp. J07HQX50]|nr:MAG: hypothetical protein J07HQX50_01484 [Haloquadratum sp. J07HQX50]
MQIGSTLFAVVLWSALLGVACVFVYELYTVTVESRSGIDN